MDIARRLERIEQEIRQVEDEKLQREQMLGAFWEHLPALRSHYHKGSYDISPRTIHSRKQEEGAARRKASAH
uniref:Uncharacterized protein n=1 Tax=Nymphaea colorata TaxID=210225 RepID=A0A5K1I0U1_9MAGN|nr:unnamed protein product [Nymphaea colorata]